MYCSTRKETGTKRPTGTTEHALRRSIWHRLKEVPRRCSHNKLHHLTLETWVLDHVDHIYLRGLPVYYFSTHKRDYFCYGYILSRSLDMVVVGSNDLYWHLYSLSTYFLNHSTSQLFFFRGQSWDWLAAALHPSRSSASLFSAASQLGLYIITI
jgi:hypothetical protein